MNKFEKLIEYIINDESDKARELFHSIVVEKSRDIYESIMDEESMEENIHGAQVQDLTHELAGEEAMGEGDDDTFDLDAGGDEGGEVSGDFPADAEHGEEGEHQDIEDKVMSIDAKVDELLAKFDEILGGDDELNAGDVEPDQGGAEGGEFGGADAGEEPIAEASGSGSGNPFAKGSGKSGSGASGSGVGSAKMEAVGSGKSGSAMSGKSGSAQSGKSGSGKMEGRKSTAELMREYVDKIQDMNLTGASEGDAVGATGKKTAVNDKSIVGPGADFGGHTATPKGGVQNQDGTSPTKASNEYNKGQGEIKSGNVNVPGGNAGKSGFKHKEGSYETSGDGQGDATGKMAGTGNHTPKSGESNTKSPLKQNSGKK
jgi:hypothetical protein